MTPDEYRAAFNKPAAEMAAEIQAGLTSKVNQISSRKELTDQAKQTAAARAHTDAAARLQQLQQAERKRLTNERRNLERRIFGNAGTADPGTAVSRRDAADRAARLDDPREALSAYRRAERDGDDHLAQAIALRAAQHGWGQVLGAYTAERPKAAEALQQLQQLPDTDNPAWLFHEAARYSAPKTGVLADLDDAAIHRAAREDLDVA